MYSGVLDLNLVDWSRITNLFSEELEAQRQKILKILEDQHVNHGHPNKSNFVLRFFRDADGKPDFTKVPRLYLIDFDQAVSLNPRENDQK